MRIVQLDVDPGPEVVRGLAQVLVDCVDGGASVGFLAGLTPDAAADWWRGVLTDPATRTWVALADDQVLGVVRLVLAQAPNSPHRADVSKLLVRRSARGRGVAGALLAAAEAGALAERRTLLVLDTETGSDAEGLYAGRGWHRVGSIADFALTPDGALSGTTIFSKRLAAPS